jgi:hypothetical protein
LKKTIPLLLILLFAALSPSRATGFVGRADAVASADEAPGGQEDEPQKTSLFQDEGDAISIYIMAACDDLALEAAIRVIAQDKLRSIEHVAVAESMEESAVLLSFSAFRTRVEEREQIVYSFAYGTPDTEFVDGVPVTLPRYIYHEAVITRPDELASRINGNITAVDSDFVRYLR